MAVLKQSVGIDISKDKFSASLMILTNDFEVKRLGFKEFKNIQSGFDALLNWIKGKAISQVDISFAMEYTGVYYENLAYYLFDKSKSVHVVLAHQVKRYAESLNIKIKTDKADSRYIGQMALERKLKKWEPCQPVFKVLKTLSREKEDVQKEITIAKNQLHSLEHAVDPYPKTLTRVKNRIKYLKTRWLL